MGMKLGDTWNQDAVRATACVKKKNNKQKKKLLHIYYCSCECELFCADSGGVKYYYWTCKSMTSTVPTPIEDEPSYTDGLKDN